MSVALWIAAMPLAGLHVALERRLLAGAVHGSPEVWNITIASYRARLASENVNSLSWTSAVMPAASSAATSFGVPCSIASVCRNASSR